VQRLTGAVTRRPFARFESWFYESAGSRAVADVLEPLLDDRLPAGDVLDVGCGGGVLALRLARAGREITGVDPSPAQVQRARRQGASVLRSGAERLPFPDGAFDALYSSCAIKHWRDRSAGLAECARVVRTGGPLLIAEIAGDATAAELRAFAGLTRIPRLAHGAYPAFAHQVMVVHSPTGAELVSDLEGVTGRPASVVPIDGLPFTLVAGTAP
jgi:SAM-dependent methyltransferase